MMTPFEKRLYEYAEEYELGEELEISPKCVEEKFNKAAKELLELAKKELQPQLPANLDEAAKKWAFETMEDVVLYGCTMSGRFAAFKAGAGWMAEQGYSEKTYVYVNRFNDENEAVIQLGQGEPKRGGFKPGDKVIVQIRKTE